MNQNRGWRILLIGGSSATGKNNIGRALARDLCIPLILVDDIRLAIQAATSSQDLPDLHFFISEGTRAYESANSVCEGLVNVAKVLDPAIRIIMAHHIVVDDAGPLILEGDGLLPRLGSYDYLVEQGFPNHLERGLIRALFLYERDIKHIKRNMESRDRGFQNLLPAAQKAQVRGSWEFGKYLLEEAQQYDINVVESRPYESLLQRVKSVLNVRIADDKLLETLHQEKGAKHHDNDSHIRV
jgi:2-phosphoglycerate kinase